MNAGVPRYAPPIKIFQKKKKKKRKPFVQVEGFKKASFSEKILPDTWLKTEAFNQKRNVFWNCLGGDFFWNPQGLNLLFWIPGTYLCSLFFLFFILNIQIKCSCLIGFYLKEWVLIWKIDVFGKGIKFFGWMNKPNHKIHKLFIRPKNLILFLLVLILRMPESQLAVSVFS